jgi:hypothetical protein
LPLPATSPAYLTNPGTQSAVVCHRASGTLSVAASVSRPRIALAVR